jgi:hypothetical protein
MIPLCFEFPRPGELRPCVALGEQVGNDEERSELSFLTCKMATQISLPKTHERRGL